MADLQEEDFKTCWIKDAQRTKGGHKENQECDIWTKTINRENTQKETKKILALKIP